MRLKQKRREQLQRLPHNGHRHAYQSVANGNHTTPVDKDLDQRLVPETGRWH